MHAQLNGASNSAMNGRVILEKQNIAINLHLRGKEIETGTSTCNQGQGDIPDGSYSNITKNSRSVFQ